jgi:elongation factor G
MRWRAQARWSARAAGRFWEGWDTLRALMPEAEIGDLIVELRSATSGVGAFETRFDHLAELSGRVADAAVAARKRAG